jgi:DNA mismatch repair protein MutS
MSPSPEMYAPAVATDLTPGTPDVILPEAWLRWLAVDLAAPTETSPSPYGTRFTWEVATQPDLQARLTPMMAQYLGVKQQAAGQLLLYRMGDFYECFFEDALVLARVLEITLTGREAGVLGKVPMAGIPVKAYESYTLRLLEEHFTIAVCEQTEPATPGKGLVERRVVRVLSPGALLEESFIGSSQAHLLASVLFEGDRCGIAHCDVSTGQFQALEVAPDEALSELDRLAPAEVIIPGERRRVAVLDAHPAMAGGGRVPGALMDWVPQWPPAWREVVDGVQGLTTWTPRPALEYDPRQHDESLKRLLRVSNLEGVVPHGPYPLACRAAGALALYLGRMFPEGLPYVDGLKIEHRARTVRLNRSARRHLEVFNTVREGRAEHSLFKLMNRALTPMGGRVLRQWLGAPLADVDALNERLDIVAFLVAEQSPLGTLRGDLARVADLERLVRRLQMAIITPREMAALMVSLRAVLQLAEQLVSWTAETMAATPPLLMALIQSALSCQPLADHLAATLVEFPGLSPREGGVILPGADAELDATRALCSNHQAYLSDYERQERERTGLKTLKVGTHQTFGYFIEVTRTALNAPGVSLPADYHRKQTLAQCERFTTPALEDLADKLATADVDRQEREMSLFQALRASTAEHAEALLALSALVAQLDVLQGFAQLSRERHYVRPLLSCSRVLKVQGMRHPILETLLPMGRFVANACLVTGSPPAEAAPTDGSSQGLPQVLMITGPNMAGKSTYMRQVALVVLMAQVGCFVPAESAEVGVVDAIYTRIGAADDLSMGQSTFMVEMAEVAEILHQATDRSLIILDEVGRGTSTFDGMAIAWSVAEHLVEAVGARTLFATHYHELNALEDTYPGQVQNVRVRVSEDDGRLTFLYRVEPGAAQKSYGIQVARMAGLPARVIRQADRRLASLLKRSLPLQRQHERVLSGKTSASGTDPQLALFTDAPS